MNQCETGVDPLAIVFSTVRRDCSRNHVPTQPARWQSRAMRLAVCLGSLSLCAVMLCADLAAQNPVGGVIRPVPGSRPLAFKTPTVGLAPVGTATTNAPLGTTGGLPTTGQVGLGFHQQGLGFNQFPAFGGNGFVDPYGYSPYGYGPYGYDPYGYRRGVITSGIGLNVGGGNGRYSIGFTRGSGISFGGGFVPGAYGASRYGYSPYGYRNVYSAYDVYLPFGYSRYRSHGYPQTWPSLDSPLLDDFGAERRLRELREHFDAFGAPDPIDLADRREPTRTPRPPASSVAQMRRAFHSVESGDELFREARYFEAQTQYRRAIRSASDLAEPHLHYAFALIATGRYETAAEHLKKAIDFDPELVTSGFRIESLYGEESEDLQKHLDEVAEFALENRGDHTALFAIGASLFFQGEVERALPFFEQARNLDPEWAFACEAFLRADVAPDVEEAGVGGDGEAPVMPDEVDPEGVDPEGVDPEGVDADGDREDGDADDRPPLRLGVFDDK